MTAHIIIQVFLLVLVAGGIYGIVKLPGVQKWIGVLIILIAVVCSFLNWFFRG